MFVVCVSLSLLVFVNKPWPALASLFLPGRCGPDSSSQETVVVRLPGPGGRETERPTRERHGRQRVRGSGEDRIPGEEPAIESRACLSVAQALVRAHGLQACLSYGQTLRQTRLLPERSRRQKPGRP